MSRWSIILLCNNHSWALVLVQWRPIWHPSQYPVWPSFSNVKELGLVLFQEWGCCFLFIVCSGWWEHVECAGRKIILYPLLQLVPIVFSWEKWDSGWLLWDGHSLKASILSLSIGICCHILLWDQGLKNWKVVILDLSMLTQVSKIWTCCPIHTQFGEFSLSQPRCAQTVHFYA